MDDLRIKEKTKIKPQSIPCCYTRQELQRLLFGWNTARKVRAQFESRLSILQLFPNMGRDEDLLKNKDGLKYRSLALPPTKIIYTIHSSYIYIHALWNTRRNPDDLSEILKDREL